MRIRKYYKIQFYYGGKVSKKLRAKNMLLMDFIETIGEMKYWDCFFVEDYENLNKNDVIDWNVDWLFNEDELQGIINVIMNNKKGEVDKLLKKLCKKYKVVMDREEILDILLEAQMELVNSSSKKTSKFSLALYYWKKGKLSEQNVERKNEFKIKFKEVFANV